MSSSPTQSTEKPPQPAGNDALEIRATEIAKRGGRKEVTDQDRQQAFQEMKQTAPPAAATEDASH